MIRRPRRPLPRWRPVDFNGNDTLRYSGVAGEPFVIGVGLPAVARVRAELVGGAVAERATVAAPFTTAAQFVAPVLLADAGIRHLVALDGAGRELTRIPINPLTIATTLESPRTRCTGAR